MAGSSFLFSLYQYLKFLNRAKGAHSLHSPFVFTLFNEVILPSRSLRIEAIESLRKELHRNHQLIDTMDFKSNTSHRKPISSIAKTSASSPKFSAFLHLLIKYLNADTVLETGTSLGLNTLYLAESEAKKTVTVEGSSILSQLAAKHFSILNHEEIIIESGDVNDVFPSVLIRHKPDLIFLDADHRGIIIKKQVDQILAGASTTQCIIIHDIYWSKDMNDAWKSLVNDPRFNLTIDIFHAGLIFLKKDMEKQHFTLRF